jgi:hypothetical protein
MFLWGAALQKQQSASISLKCQGCFPSCVHLQTATLLHQDWQQQQQQQLAAALLRMQQQ